MIFFFFFGFVSNARKLTWTERGDSGRGVDDLAATFYRVAELHAGQRIAVAVLAVQLVRRSAWAQIRLFLEDFGGGKKNK